MDLSKLKEPFKADDIEWRLQQCGERKDGSIWGKCLAYITSRAVQERLDEVCGADGWRSDIRKDGNAYLCTLSIRTKRDDGSSEWISRTDGADATDIESVKGGISGALKRAAVQFGIIQKGEVSPSLQPASRSCATPSAVVNPRNAPEFVSQTKYISSEYSKNHRNLVCYDL